MCINTILFDLDGTLVDTAPDLAYALNYVLQEEGYLQKPYEQVKPLVALGGKALIKFGFDCDESDAKFHQRHQRLLKIYTDNIDKFSKPFDQITTLLNNLKRKNMYWGVVTNKPEGLSKLLIDKLNLKPDVIVGGDTLAFNKPHPAPLLYACAQLGVLPKNCLFVGDDKNDMLAGRSAQIKTVAVRYGYGDVKKDWNYDYLINSSEELLELI